MLVEMSRQENKFNMFRNIGTQRIDGFSRWCLPVYILSSAREIVLSIILKTQLGQISYGAGLFCCRYW